MYMNAEFSKVVISLLQDHLFRILPFLLYLLFTLEYDVVLKRLFLKPMIICAL